MHRLVVALALTTAAACSPFDPNDPERPPFGDLDGVLTVRGEAFLLACDVPYAFWEVRVRADGFGVSSANGSFRLRLGDLVGNDGMFRWASLTMTDLVSSDERFVITLEASAGQFHVRAGKASFFQAGSVTVLDRLTGRRTSCSGGNFEVTLELAPWER